MIFEPKNRRSPPAPKPAVTVVTCTKAHVTNDRLAAKEGARALHPALSRAVARGIFFFFRGHDGRRSHRL